MRGEKSRRGRRSTTKKGRTAVWDIGRRRSLLHRWGRLSPATLCWLRRPQPQTRSRKVSYDLVREERGQVNTNTVESPFSLLKRGIVGTWHRLSAKHLPAYLNEMTFRFNRRKSRDLFVDTLRHRISAPVLTFVQVTS